jgi:hypothetical protein
MGFLVVRSFALKALTALMNLNSISRKNPDPGRDQTRIAVHRMHGKWSAHIPSLKGLNGRFH